MPIYEYRCGKCGEVFELLVRSMSSPPPDCPKCGRARAEKIFSVCASHGGSSNGGSSASCGSCSSGACSTCAR